MSINLNHIAERYETDIPMEFGDLVKLGGRNEITFTTEPNDPDAFGVVSENPGLCLNSCAGDDETHPYIALAGRVKCKVIGLIEKGQRLSSSDLTGVAQAYDGIDYFCIFGRALESKFDHDIKLIEVIVGVK